MANIEQDLQAIMDARYGKDVRQSIHDAIYDINEVNETNISTVQTIANTARGYANNASNSANTAEQAVTDAQAQVTLAQQQVALATTQAENASDSAEDSEAWAIGKRAGVDVPSTDPAYENNAKYWQEQANYWYQQAQAIAESFSGALRPMGTVAFANLPPVSEAEAGDMYNVSDEFTTTSDFVEGAGIVVPLGSNVYLTVGHKWDILAGSPVTGIKGNSESNYRRGNVNITKTNIGLGNVDNTSDANKPISTATQTALDAKINTTDIINNLTSTATNKPLSAAQGKALKDSLGKQVINTSHGKLIKTSNSYVWQLMTTATTAITGNTPYTWSGEISSNYRPPTNVAGMGCILDGNGNILATIQLVIMTSGDVIFTANASATGYLRCQVSW